MELFGYKSCIKVKGIKLLPPLITAKKRIELNNDKIKAIEIEKRLKYERDLKAFIDSLEPSVNKNLEDVIERTGSTSLEHKVAFNTSNDLKVHQGRDVARVPCDKKNLISYVFDVTEYNKDGIVLLSSDDTRSSASTAEALINCDKIVTSPREKSKLIRSNSYTLKSPSPALLQYLRNQEKEKSTIFPRDSQLDYSSVLYDSAYETLEDKDNSVQNENKKLQESSIMDENFLSFDNETIDSLIKTHFNETQVSPIDINLMDSRLDELEASLDEFLGKQTSESYNCDSSLQNRNRQHYDVTSRSEINSTVFNTSTPLLIDFESDSCENEMVPNFQRNATHIEIDSDPLHVLMCHDDYKRLSSDNRVVGCSRKLFSDKEHRMAKEKWAATVLTAAARGYLVRRLKRTELVKGLIQTIHDTIICAFNLHRDDVDSIPEADIELHRRLIVQLTSACHEFYNTFFTLSTRERMALIAQDRQRKMHKLKRASMKLETNRLSAKSQRQSINKITKSLTPTFAA